MSPLLYGKGTRVRLDLFLSGFPKAVVLDVLEPGSGRNIFDGRIRVRLLQDAVGYTKGEVLELTASSVVPIPHIRALSTGHYRINVNYMWECITLGART